LTTDFCDDFSDDLERRRLDIEGRPILLEHSNILETTYGGDSCAVLDLNAVGARCTNLLLVQVVVVIVAVAVVVAVVVVVVVVVVSGICECTCKYT